MNPLVRFAFTSSSSNTLGTGKHDITAHITAPALPSDTRCGVIHPRSTRRLENPSLRLHRLGLARQLQEHRAYRIKMLQHDDRVQ